jgi:uncharacterized membrane-anchored protein
MRKYILIIVAIFVLGIINFMIFQKEQTIRSGQTVLLKLVPVDPRSLMQGDYMILRYAMAAQVGDLKNKGKLVIKLDNNNVASFVRVHKGETLMPGELLLMCRNRGRMRLGAESFLFQEGLAHIYADAKYGELKVDASGNSVLIGLCDNKLRQITVN